MAVRARNRLRSPTYSLSIFHVVVMGVVGGFLLAAAILLHRELAVQAGEAHLVNIAGRQRMLSQRLAKLAFQIQMAPNSDERRQLRTEFQTELNHWSDRHIELQTHGSSTPSTWGAELSVEPLFRNIEPRFQALRQDAIDLLDSPLEATVVDIVLRLNDDADGYLKDVEKFVASFDQLAQHHALALRSHSFWLLMMALSSLLAAELFAFRPAIRKIRAQVVQLRKAEEALMQSQETFHSVLINALIGMALVSLEGRFNLVNRSLCRITGYSEAEILATDFQSITHPEDLDADLALMHRVLAGEIDSYEMEKRYLHKAGHQVWILLSVCIVKDFMDRPLYFIAQIEDVTERRREQDQLAAQSARLRAIFDHAVDAIVAIDERGSIESFNPAAIRLFGYSQAEAVGQNINLIMPAPYHTEQEVYIANYLQSHFGKVTGVGHEAIGLRKNGTKFPLELTISEFDLPSGRHFTAIVRDITARKHAEAVIEDAQHRLVRANRELCRLAVLDSLTGIPNRRAFEERLDEEWSRAMRTGGLLSLIMIDVDHFKAYNDSLGHVEGDGCLRAVALELHRCVRRLPDFVARYGGEEFVALLPGADAAGALALADWMRERVQFLNLPHPASSIGPCVTISLGVATFIVDRYLDAASLVRAADQALYQSKEHGRNCIHVAASHVDAPSDHADHPAR